MKQRLKESIPFLIAFFAVTALVVPFYWFYLEGRIGSGNMISRLVDGLFSAMRFPVSRPDMISFAAGATVCGLTGWLRSRCGWRTAIYALAAIAIAPLFWDNAWIQIRLIHHAQGKFVFDLSGNMEVQYIHIYLTVAQYRFFTLFFAGIGLAGLLFARKPVHVIFMALAVCFMFTSIAISLFLGHGLTAETMSHHSSALFVSINLVIGAIFAAAAASVAVKYPDPFR